MEREEMLRMLATELPTHCTSRYPMTEHAREYQAFLSAVDVEALGPPRFYYEIASEFLRDFAEPTDANQSRRAAEKTDHVTTAPRFLRPLGASCACGRSMDTSALQCASCSRRSALARAA